MVIIHENKQFLHNLYKEIKIKIKELNITLKPNHQIINIDKEGINFVGYIIYKDHIKLRKRTKLNFIEKINQMKESNYIN